jgi:hypothetical protein
VVGGLVAAGVLWPDSNDSLPETFGGGDAYVYEEPETVELTRVERAKALSTAANFVTHAVARRKVELAYDIVAPSLKGGISRAEWRTADIPVVPFPVDVARWKVEYSYADALGLQVLIFPPARSKLRPSVFAMELTPTGNGRNRWLVSSWAPVGMTAGAAPAAQSSGPGGVPNLSNQPPDQEARLGAKWLLAPVALLAVVPMIVVAFYVQSWRRGRRAAAAYAPRDRPI